MKRYTAEELQYFGASELIELALELQKKVVMKWNIELFVNGELQVRTKLTDTQIKAVTELIKTLSGEK